MSKHRRNTFDGESWYGTDSKGWAVVGTFLAAVLLIFGLGYMFMPSAHAADAYVVVSIGFVNENPPVVVVGGIGVAPDENAAFQASLSDCQNKGGNHCVAQASSLNGCAAAASNDFGEFKGASAANAGAAGAAATGQLSNQQGARVVVSGCAHRQIPPEMIENPPTAVIDDPNAPPPPPPSPTPVPCQPQPICQYWPSNLPTIPNLVPGG